MNQAIKSGSKVSEEGTTMATVEQIATINARRVDDTARQMMLEGVSLTWEEADEVGDEACDWIARRLGLSKATDAEGVHFVVLDGVQS